MGVLIELWKALGVGILIPGVFIFFLLRADGEVHHELRNRFAAFLLAAPEERASTGFISWFLDIFNLSFEERILTWKFFLRSAVASLLSLITVLIVYAIVIVEKLPDPSVLPILMGGILAFAIICNLFPDWISLIESKLIIQSMKNQKFINVVGLLICDLVLTTAIILVSVAVFYFVVSWGSDALGVYPFGRGSGVDLDFDDILPLYLDGLTFGSSRLSEHSLNGLVGVYIYTTYFTSVWVWLYSIAVSLMRIGGIMRPVRKILPVDKRPFRSVGLVMVIPTVLVSLIVVAIF